MATPRGITGHTLRARRRGMIGWAIGIGAYTAITVAFWPAMPEMADLERLMEQMPESLMAVFGGGADDLFSPAGFLDSQLFAMISPLLLLIVAAGGASGTIAGEERDGTLELLLAYPVSRRRVVLEKAAGIAVVVGALTAVHLIVIVVMVIIVDLGIDFSNLIAMHVSLLLLVYVFGALALALSAASGRRGIAVGATAAVAAAAYLLESFATLVDRLEPLRPLSPFYLYRGHEPLVHGLDLVHASALAGLTLGLVAVAVVTFERRDIRA